MSDINGNLHSAFAGWLFGLLAKEYWRFVCTRFGVSYCLLVWLTVAVCVGEAFSGAAWYVQLAGFLTLFGWAALGLRLVQMVLGSVSGGAEA